MPSREAWQAFVRHRRHRYQIEPDFYEHVEAYCGSIEVRLFGVERKFINGRFLDPSHYLPDAIYPPERLSTAEIDLLSRASVEILWA